MPLALLLSPDDQAVSAITAVLEELSVTCERPLDGVSAAKQLNSHNFDLVLVDCENLPAAKLIFDVCRRGKSGKNPIPIAIVDGRAGLPTAFRLGAELILTKPVAKDQARSTIRTAVNRVKKDDRVVEVQVSENLTVDTYQPEPATSAEVSTDSRFEADMPYRSAAQAPTELLVLGAAASAQGQSSLPSVIPASSAVATMMSTAAALPSARSSSVENVGMEVSESKPEPVSRIVDESALTDQEKADARAQANLTAPVFSAYQEQEKSKIRGPLLALVAIALICGGLYAAWITQPGFRTLVQPQIDSLLALAGMSHHSQTVAPDANPAKPTAPLAPAVAPASQEGSTQSSESATTNATTNFSTPSSASAPAAAPEPASSEDSHTPVNTAASSTVTPSVTATASASKADDDKTSAKQNAGITKTTNSENSSIAIAVGTNAPDDGTTVILSSKGAEKRLTHSVQPTYPASARTTGEDKVVLKVVVDENGKVARAQVTDGNQTLAGSAIAAVKQWRYRPYLRDGKAVPFETVVQLDFQR